MKKRTKIILIASVSIAAFAAISVLSFIISTNGGKGKGGSDRQSKPVSSTKSDLSAKEISADTSMLILGEGEEVSVDALRGAECKVDRPEILSADAETGTLTAAAYLNTARAKTEDGSR